MAESNSNTSLNHKQPYVPWEMLFVFICLAGLPFGLRGGGHEYLAMEILVWCIYAMGYNLALGYTGLPSFGHGAYFGIGAYGMAVYQAVAQGSVTVAENDGFLSRTIIGLFRLMPGDGECLWMGLFCAVFAAAITAGIAGLFIAHRRGIYFALMTIAFGQIFWFCAVKLRSVTKGEDGIQNLKRLPVTLGFTTIEIREYIPFYFFIFVIFCVTILFLWTLIHSPFGRVIQAIKQNEMRARFVGYDVRIYKWVAFTLSAGIAGLAGGLFALLQQNAYPNVMELHESGIVVMMVVIGGGFVSFWGPMLGTAYYFIMRAALKPITEEWELWFGLSFMLIVMFKPEGLAGVWKDLWGEEEEGDEERGARGEEEGEEGKGARGEEESELA